jgi:two-component system chemotaxis sensor kinase CheA
MNDQLLETFREEATELLSELENSLLELEDNTADSAAVDRVFRSLHTIKGSSAMVGLDEISDFLHDIESVYDLVREGDLVVTRELINLTLLAKDQLKVLVGSLMGDDKIDSEVLNSIAAQFGEMLPKQISEQIVKSEMNTDSDESTTYRIRFRPVSDMFKKGLNPLFILRELKLLGDCLIIPQLDEIPPLETLQEEQCYLHWDIVLTTDRNPDDIRDIFIFIEDNCLELTLDIIDDGGLLDTESGYKKLGEILVERGDLNEEQLNKALQSKGKIGEELIGSGLVSAGAIETALAEQKRVQEIRQVRKNAETTSSIRVRSDKLDALVNLIGELVTVQARLSQYSSSVVDSDLLSIAEEVEHLTWDLRDQVLNIRMIPIGTTFTRYRRLVRDLSSELDKKVALETVGAETELDKTVIDQLSDPLVHLIRNSVDHGIETPAVRVKVGKPEIGTVRLSAAHTGAYVTITISDDGRGLDRDALLKRARELGLISQDADPSDRDIWNFIFTPGFSTAESVTSVSGRGVGMDVVKRSVEELRGSIEVHSHPGCGTEFNIKLPLTLAIIDGLLVNISGESYVFPLSAVEECVELRRAAVVTNERNLANVRGEIVPYVKLREYFAMPESERDIEQIVIAKIDGVRVGFVVDYVVGEHQTVIKSLGKFYHGIKGLSGATILGNGSVALILDLSQIADKAEFLENTNF